MPISVRNLKYTYSPGMPGETLALDDVSFDIEDGQLCGIIGHTGSGKSTLLQHLNGLIKPQEGSIVIDGECITDGSTSLVDIRKKVGLVFQYPEYQLFEETVEKDVAFGPKNLGLSEEEIAERVRNAMELVGLDFDKIADKSPFELSGGQKRRVAIAGVIAMNPRVLILDEPTAGIDPEAHEEIISMIEEIREKLNIIVIFVSHNMADVVRLSDKVFVINEGKLAAEGTPLEVFSRVDFLRSMGLDVPPVVGIMKSLQDKAGDIDPHAMTADEAADEVYAYLEG